MFDILFFSVTDVVTVRTYFLEVMKFMHVSTIVSTYVNLKPLI